MIADLFSLMEGSSILALLVINHNSPVREAYRVVCPNFTNGTEAQKSNSSKVIEPAPKGPSVLHYLKMVLAARVMCCF